MPRKGEMGENTRKILAQCRRESSTVDELMTLTKLQMTTVRTAIVNLVDQGLIKVVARRMKGRAARINVYGACDAPVEQGIAARFSLEALGVATARWGSSTDAPRRWCWSSSQVRYRPARP